MFGGKNVIIFANFYQLPPVLNPSGAMWIVRESTSALSLAFIYNCHEISVPLTATTCNPTKSLSDKIRTYSISDQDWSAFNLNVSSPAEFACRTSSETSIIITTSRSRCLQWNSILPKIVADYLHKTLYICNAVDIVYFGAGSSLHMQLVDDWKDRISNTGSILGRIPLFLGMPCSIAIDSTPIWGVVHDIVLDQREVQPSLRPSVVQLRFPPAVITVCLAPEVLRWNSNLHKILHVKPVIRRFDLRPSFPASGLGEITRTQTPVTPLFASMEHEVTGRYFKSILIDMTDGLKSFLSLYAVLSRAGLDGKCWITEKVAFEPYEVYLPLVKATLQRMSCT